MTLGILVADDNSVARLGLRTLLEAEEHFQVVAEAGDGRTAVAMESELHPDLVVLGVSLPNLNGIEATRQIVERNRQARVLGLSTNSDARTAARMLRAGALGYILKQSPSEEIMRAARAVASGNTFLGFGVAEVLVQDYLRLARSHETDPDVELVLTPREREVLQLLSEGQSTKATASMLEISIKTAETHRRQIMDKLGLRSIAQLTKYAIREGITGLE
jgi:DNA-binding NarL/FixJ family response regulator